MPSNSGRDSERCCGSAVEYYTAMKMGALLLCRAPGRSSGILAEKKEKSSCRRIQTGYSLYEA